MVVVLLEHGFLFFVFPTILLQDDADGPKRPPRKASFVDYSRKHIIILKLKLYLSKTDDELYLSLIQPSIEKDSFFE